MDFNLNSIGKIKEIKIVEGFGYVTILIKANINFELSLTKQEAYDLTNSLQKELRFEEGLISATKWKCKDCLQPMKVNARDCFEHASKLDAKKCKKVNDEYLNNIEKFIKKK